MDMSEAPIKISIVTTAYNSAETIEDTLRSVADQSYKNIEHIVIDGASMDDTMTIANRFPHISKKVSEPDSGIYNAMNKGFKLATGDYIGVLNSDDYLTHNEVIAEVVSKIEETATDAVIGDIKVVDRQNVSKVVRYASSKNFKKAHLAKGIMPPHATYYAKRSVYDTWGYFKEDYKICADYELVTRHMVQGDIDIEYVDTCFVTMRAGGVSNGSLKKIIERNKEIMRAIRENNLDTNIFKFLSKFFPRMLEFINPRP